MTNITDQINRLTRIPSKRRTLSEIDPRPAIGESRGQATVGAPPADSSQLTPPLTEVARTTYTKIVDVPENATQVEIECVQTLTMRDARGYDYVFNFSQP